MISWNLDLFGEDLADCLIALDYSNHLLDLAGNPEIFGLVKEVTTKLKEEAKQRDISYELTDEQKQTQRIAEELPCN